MLNGLVALHGLSGLLCGGRAHRLRSTACGVELGAESDAHLLLFELQNLVSIIVLFALYGLAGLLCGVRREGSRGRASSSLNGLVALHGLAGLLCGGRALRLRFTAPGVELGAELDAHLLLVGLQNLASLNLLIALHGLAGLLRGGRRKGSRGRASCSPSLLQVLCFTTPLLITFGLLRQTASID